MNFKGVDIKHGSYEETVNWSHPLHNHGYYKLFASKDGATMRPDICFAILSSNWESNGKRYCGDVWVHGLFTDDEVRMLNKAGTRIEEATVEIKGLKFWLVKSAQPHFSHYLSLSLLRNSVENKMFIPTFRHLISVGVPTISAAIIAEATTYNTGHSTMCSFSGMFTLAKHYATAKLLAKASGDASTGWFMDSSIMAWRIISEELGEDPKLLPEKKESRNAVKKNIELTADEFMNADFMHKIYTSKTILEAIELVNQERNK